MLIKPHSSQQLGLNQELIELDLFNFALAKFSPQEFEEAGLGPDERFLIKYFADQEIGHAKLFENMLGSNASEACQYSYPFQTVREFIDFSMKITRLGESGTLGFLPHLNSQAAAALINQAITTESRQEFAFRQFEGLFPVPVSLTRCYIVRCMLMALAVLVHAYHYSKHAMDFAGAVYHCMPCEESETDVAELPCAQCHGEHTNFLIPILRTLVSACATSHCLL